jgi:NAD(P)-dependent dehydrogenase (short-subunit alcohol dehydrogenase family)
MSTVLGTGAGRGIGRAITEEFIRRGHRVIGTARDPRSLHDLDLAERLALDVTDDASVAAASRPPAMSTSSSLIPPTSSMPRWKPFR